MRSISASVWISWPSYPLTPAPTWRPTPIYDIIRTMPQGDDSSVGERGELAVRNASPSRALVRNPRILFLDESTSALDLSTVIAVGETLECICYGGTVIAVIHRLASITHDHRIFVMDQRRLAAMTARSSDHGRALTQCDVRVLIANRAQILKRWWARKLWETTQPKILGQPDRLYARSDFDPITQAAVQNRAHRCQ